MFVKIGKEDGFLFLEAETGIISETKESEESGNQGRFLQVLPLDEALEKYADNIRCPLYLLVDCCGLSKRAFCLFKKQWVGSDLSKYYICFGNWHNCPHLREKELV